MVESFQTLLKAHRALNHVMAEFELLLTNIRHIKIGPVSPVGV
jgi:hypothetical protein